MIDVRVLRRDIRIYFVRPDNRRYRLGEEKKFCVARAFVLLVSEANSFESFASLEI